MYVHVVVQVRKIFLDGTERIFEEDVCDVRARVNTCRYHRELQQAEFRGT